jgi:hypothetical protein
MRQTSAPPAVRELRCPATPSGAKNRWRLRLPPPATAMVKRVLDIEPPASAPDGSLITPSFQTSIAFCQELTDDEVSNKTYTGMKSQFKNPENPTFPPEHPPKFSAFYLFAKCFDSLVTGASVKTFNKNGGGLNCPPLTARSQR